MNEALSPRADVTGLSIVINRRQASRSLSMTTVLEEALREGRRAVELLPLEKDSINGTHMIEYFAITAAWVGEKDIVCEQLAKAEQLPHYGTITYGQLKLMPYWDPLRGDPRFEKIVSSLAPKL